MNEKTGPEIISTKEYGKFKILECNRKIKEPYLRTLVFSIQAQNMLRYRPILVDSDMNVIDGQHRLEAAKRLEVPIYYQVKKSAEDEHIITLNKNQKRWDIDDYINYYSAKMVADYIKLLEYKKVNKLPTTVLLKSLGVGGGIYISNIKEGKFKFPSEERVQQTARAESQIKQIKELLNRYIIVNNKFLDSNRLRIALVKFLKHPEMKFETLMKKLSMKCESVRACSSESAYLDMLISIYNWKNQEPIRPDLENNDLGGNSDKVED